MKKYTLMMCAVGMMLCSYRPAKAFEPVSLVIFGTFVSTVALTYYGVSLSEKVRAAYLKKKRKKAAAKQVVAPKNSDIVINKDDLTKLAFLGTGLILGMLASRREAVQEFVSDIAQKNKTYKKITY